MWGSGTEDHVTIRGTLANLKCPIEDKVALSPICINEHNINETGSAGRGLSLNLLLSSTSHGPSVTLVGFLSASSVGM